MRLAQRMNDHGFLRFFLAPLAAAWLSIVVGAQQQTVQELLRELPGMEEPAALNAHVWLANEFSTREPARAIEHGNQAVALLERYPDVEVERILASAMALGLGSAGHFEEAERWARRAVELLDSEAGELAQWTAWKRLGEAKARRGAFDEALADLERCVELADVLDEVDLRVTTHMAIGRLKIHARRYDEALESMLTAEAVADGHELARSVEADLMNELGSIYFFLGRHEKALVYYRRAETLWEGQARLQVVVKQNIGGSLTKLERFEESLEVNLPALELAESIGDAFSVAQLNYNIAMNLRELEMYEDALGFAQDAYEQIRAFEDAALIARVTVCLGSVCLALDRKESAEAYLSEGLELARRAEDVHALFSAHDALASFREASGEFERALEHRKRVLELREELDERDPQKLADLESHFATLGRDREIERLEGDVQEERETRNLALLASLATGALALLVFLLWRSQRRAMRALSSAHTELESTYRALKEQTRLAESREGEIKVLSGLLPICASCKSIRDDAGSWKALEEYLHDHSEATLTHGWCPVCMQRVLEEAGHG